MTFFFYKLKKINNPKINTKFIENLLVGLYHLKFRQQNILQSENQRANVSGVHGG